MKTSTIRRKITETEIQVKLKVLTDLENGLPLNSVAKDLNVSPATVRGWVRNKDQLRQWQSVQHNIPARRKRIKKPVNSDVDEATWSWFKEQRAAGCPITGPLIRAQALRFWAEFGGSTDFGATDGWLTKWKTRHGVRISTDVGEKSLDPGDPIDCKERIPRISEHAKVETHQTPGATKSAFGGFSGFKTTPTPTTAAFSFLKSNSTSTAPPSPAPAMFSLTRSSNGSAKSAENGLSSSSLPSMHVKAPEAQKSPPKEKDTIFKESSEYFAKLKGLNEGVAQWIKTHVDANPYCILTPIFRDYDRYLKEIEAKREEQKKTAESPKPPPTLTFGKIPSKETSESESLFSGKTSAAGAPSIFASGAPAKSIFGATEGNPFLKPSAETPVKVEATQEEKLETKALSFPQTTATFSFGQSSSSSSTSSASFAFGSGKPFSFGSSVVAPAAEGKEDEEKEDEDEPPKVEIKPVTEEGAVYEKRCKVFFKKDGVYSDRGIGIIFLKPTPNGKTQLIVRAENSLGNLLINTLLTESIRTQRMNKNTVMVMCLPLPDSQPPPVPVLLRVKSTEDADNLIEALDSNKK